MNAPFTIEEILAALQALPRHSCPGEDALTPEFFLMHWETLASTICSGFECRFDSGIMPESMNEGLIFLIPKGEGRSIHIHKWRKWRPISVLNTIYKIYAKTLNNRMAQVIPRIIHSSQTGFVPERCIFYNVFRFLNATIHVETKIEDLVVLMLDFVKSYDCVDWASLHATVSKLCFDEK